MSEHAKTEEDEANERRVAPRVRTLKRARLMFNNRFSTIDCVVRNVSATGALLTIDTAVQLPRIFEIRIGEEGEIRSAKLVYRREMFAGIHFIDQGEEAGSSREASDEPSTSTSIEPVRAAPLPDALVARFAWTRYR